MNMQIKITFQNYNLVSCRTDLPTDDMEYHPSFIYHHLIHAHINVDLPRQNEIFYKFYETTPKGYVATEKHLRH